MRLNIIIFTGLLVSACSPAPAAPAEPINPAGLEMQDASETGMPGAETEPASPAGIAGEPAQRDARLAGTWVNESTIDMGEGNTASYTVVMTMELFADGRSVRSSEGVGCSPDIRIECEPRIDFDGLWRADGETLYMGIPGLDFMNETTYRFAGETLVTQGTEGSVVWQRRQ